MIKPALAAIALALGLACGQPAVADDAKPIKIALIASKTGPYETYARDTERGLRLGLEYYTQGTMKVLGRDIELIVKDDQFKPDLSKVALTEAYGDDKADIAVGTTWSGGALAIAPIAEDYKKLLIIEPAIAELADRRKLESLSLQSQPELLPGCARQRRRSQGRRHRRLSCARLRLRKGRGRGL